MTERDECEHCGGLISPRTDPRGRKARYCSDACRAAASRKRREQNHRDALAEARQHLALEAHDPDDSVREAASTLRKIAASLRAGQRPLVTHAVGDLIKAGHELNAAMEAVNAAEATPARMNRAQRRRRRR